MKFAVDTKLFRKTKKIGDKQKLQDDIDKLVRWSEKLQMLFNFGKCKCLHTGPGNTGMNYEMGGNILSKTVKEKDLGVTMNANMKISEQCRIAASKGNQVLGMIRRNLTYNWGGSRVMSRRVYLTEESFQTYYCRMSQAAKNGDVPSEMLAI